MRGGTKKGLPWWPGNAVVICRLVSPRKARYSVSKLLPIMRFHRLAITTESSTKTYRLANPKRWNMGTSVCAHSLHVYLAITRSTMHHACFRSDYTTNNACNAASWATKRDRSEPVVHFVKSKQFRAQESASVCLSTLHQKGPPSHPRWQIDTWAAL